MIDNAFASSTTSSTNQDTNDLLTVEQAASYLQMSSSSIRGYIRKGSLKAFRIAGLRKVLIAREDLQSLLYPAEENRNP